MRLALAVAFAVALQACAAPGATRAWRAEDLDRPGAMEALEREHPAHFAKVQRIVREAQDRPFDAVPEWMRSELGARDVEGLLFAVAGEGVQARFTFAFDGRLYTKLIRAR